MAVAGNVGGVLFLADVPVAYRPTDIDGWAALSAAHPSATVASALFFILGLLALAGWATGLGRRAATPSARFGGTTIAAGAMLNAAGCVAPLVLVAHVVPRCGEAACAPVARALLGLTLSLDALFNLLLGIGLLVLGTVLWRAGGASRGRARRGGRPGVDPGRRPALLRGLREAAGRGRTPLARLHPLDELPDVAGGPGKRPPVTFVLATSAAAVTLYMVVAWLVSLRLRDASIADVFWGPGFALVGVLSAAISRPSGRGVLLAALTCIWGVRLALHIGARWRKKKEEDRRYQAMRAGWGDRFPLASLFTVFLLQGALLWVVSLPLQVGAALGAERPLGLLDAAGVLLFGVGLGFEAVGDAQLARFLSDPASRGRVMETGLWRYTRHPNYFGDALLWWGLGLVGAATGAYWCLLGPALMTFLLVRVSGVSLLEKDIAGRRPEYVAYMRRTSPFLPMPPSRAP